MKVLNLRCANGHGFEGWFASEDDFMQQNGSGRLQCPLCSDSVVTRMPSAPRLNLSGAREIPASPVAPSTGVAQALGGHAAQAGTAVTALDSPDLQAAWLKAVRELMARTEDVGDQFAEEARRIHYGESSERGIRGQATPEQRAALLDEGIETVAIPVPAALKGPVQ